MNTPTSTPPINHDALNQLVGKMLNDMGATASSALVLLGDRLGLYHALREIGPVTSAQFAAHTKLAERYLREWLACQAASGYVEYDAAKNTFSLSPEQVAIFADPESPVSMTGGYYSLASLFHDEPKAEDAFRTGRGIGWGEHHPCLFCGTAKFFRTGYVTYLISQWIPALDGVKQKLEAGIRVADIGCGFGVSTLLMAKAFPKSEFVGFDIHPDSVAHAENHAREQGLTNVRFVASAAKEVPGKDYGLVTIFDALHDMGDPVGAAKHIRSILSPDGTWMIVEPMAGNSLQENLNPVGRIFYAFSTMVCVPASLSQEVGLALGAQAGEAKLKAVVTEGGFTRFRRATETPFNIILEARP
jgi:SAM-dependent methyltransferase